MQYFIMAAMFLILPQQLFAHGLSTLIASDTSNKLIVLDEPEEKLLLNAGQTGFPQVTGWLNGISNNFDYLTVNDPNNNIVTLTGNFSLRVKPVSIEAGAGLLRFATGQKLDHTSPNSNFISLDSGSHNDITWFIDSDVTGTDFIGCKTIMLKIVDNNGQYSDSDPFTVKVRNHLSPDIMDDDRVDMRDASVFAGQWQQGGCGTPTWCNLTDLDRSGTVDIADFMLFVNNWLIMDPLI